VTEPSRLQSHCSGPHNNIDSCGGSRLKVPAEYQDQQRNFTQGAKYMSSGIVESKAPVLFVSTNDAAPWGGSEELWFETALRMAKEGWPVVASVRNWPDRARQLATLEAATVRVIEHGAPGVPQRIWRKAFPDQKYDWLRKLQPRFALISQGEFR
jgi:hypothetical protein